MSDALKKAILSDVIRRALDDGFEYADFAPLVSTLHLELEKFKVAVVDEYARVIERMRVKDTEECLADLNRHRHGHPDGHPADPPDDTIAKGGAYGTLREWVRKALLTEEGCDTIVRAMRYGLAKRLVPFDTMYTASTWMLHHLVQKDFSIDDAHRFYPSAQAYAWVRAADEEMAK